MTKAPAVAIPLESFDEHEIETMCEGERYAAYGCGKECSSETPVRHAIHSFQRNTLWRSSGRFTKWESSSSNVEVHISSGTGQIKAPFLMTPECFAETCETLEFSPRLLAKLRGKKPFFEYTVHRTDERITHLEVALSSYEVDSYLVIARYDIAANSIRAIVSFKSVDQVTLAPVRRSNVIGWLEAHAHLLQEQPLTLIPILLSLLQQRNHAPVRWRSYVLAAEGKLGVTRRRLFLENSGYPQISYDYELISAELASLGRDLSDTRMSASTIRLQIMTFDRIVGMFVQHRSSFTTSALLLAQEIDGVVARVDNYLIQVEASQNILGGLNNVLSNRINQHETGVLKSIAVIGLIFLPLNLVAAIFASGIVDLGNNQVLISPTVSPASRYSQHNYTPLFVSICLGVTLLTVFLWALWTHLGTRWFDRLHKSRLSTPWPVQRQIPMEEALREKQLVESGQALCALGVRNDVSGTMPSSMSNGSACLDGYCEHVGLEGYCGMA
jgi:hypothetical protein